MPALSTYAQNKIAEHATGKTSWTLPTCYLAATTATPTAGSTGSTISEPSGNGYARVSLSGDWATSSGGTITTNATISFPQATGAWGTINSVAVCDASTAGNVIFWASLSVTKSPTTGDTLTFPAGSLSFSIS